MKPSGQALRDLFATIVQNADTPRRFDDPNNHQQIQLILENQKMMAQALLIIGLTLDTIVTEQLNVYISAPEHEQRS